MPIWPILLRFPVPVVASASRTASHSPHVAMSNILDQVTTYARENPGVVAGACLAVLLIGITQIVLTTSSNPSSSLSTDFSAFPLIEKRSISHNTRIFRFALPTPTSKLGLPLGRHVSLRALIDGKEVRRPYTPISSDNTEGHFDLLIKVYPSPYGLMGNHLDSLRLGETIDIRGPLGKFTYSPAAQRRICMICGGTGITPMWQILAAVLSDPADRTFISLIFANLTEADILMREQLDDLANTHPNRFSVYYVLNDAPPGWTGGVGFVTKDVLLQQFGSADTETSDDALVLMCGPPPMNKAVKSALDQLGYPEKQIFKF